MPADASRLRYSSAYEEQINPFKAFGAQERQRKYNALNPADKFSLSLVCTRAVDQRGH